MNFRSKETSLWCICCLLACLLACLRILPTLIVVKGKKNVMLWITVEVEMHNVLGSR